MEGVVPLTGLEPVTPSLRRQGLPSRKALCHNYLGLGTFDEMRLTQRRPKVSREALPARCLRKALWSNGVVGCDPLLTHYRKLRRRSAMGGERAFNLDLSRSLAHGFER